MILIIITTSVIIIIIIAIIAVAVAAACSLTPRGRPIAPCAAPQAPAGRLLYLHGMGGPDVGSHSRAVMLPFLLKHAAEGTAPNLQTDDKKVTAQRASQTAMVACAASERPAFESLRWQRR